MSIAPVGVRAATLTAAQRDERVKLDLLANATFEGAARVFLAVKPEDIRPDESEADK